MQISAKGLVIWFIATLFAVYAFTLNTAAGVFSEAIKSSLQISNINAAIASGAFILGFAAMQIPAGYLLDKFNARYVISLGILLLALGNVLTSYADTFILFCLSNGLQGIGASFAFLGAAILTSEWFAAALFPIMFGLTQTITCISTGITHYYFMLLLEKHSWNIIYQGLALFGAILFIFSISLIRSPNKDENKTSFLSSLKQVFANKQILLCSIAAAMSFGILLAYASLWHMTVQQFYGVENLEAILIGGLIFIGIGIGTPIMGYLSNKLQSRVAVIQLTTITGTMALLLGLYLPHFNFNTLIITKIIAFFIGFLLSGSMLYYTLVNELADPAIRGVAISVLNTAVFLFNTIMLFFPYLLITHTSTTYYTHLWILPFCTLFSLILLYFIKDTLSNKI